MFFEKQQSVVDIFFSVFIARRISS